MGADRVSANYMGSSSIAVIFQITIGDAAYVSYTASGG